MTTWSRVVAAHVASDVYCDGSNAHGQGRRLWWSSAVTYGTRLFVVGYVAVAALRSHGTAAVESSMAPGTHGILYTSPEGLSMTVHHPFPAWYLSVHRWAGLLLVPLCFAQKHTVPHMVSRRSASGEAARRAHAVLGYLTLGSMGYMAVYGFRLRSASTFQGFGTAMIGFVAPWLLFLAVAPLTAWKKWRVAHAAVGSAIFKACVAVPLARTLGVVFQLLSRSAPEKLARDYYAGIATSAVVVGIWAICDTNRFLKYLKEVEGRDEDSH